MVRSPLVRRSDRVIDFSTSMNGALEAVVGAAIANVQTKGRARPRPAG